MAVPGYLEGIRTPTVLNTKGLYLSLPPIPKKDHKVLAVLNCSVHGREDQKRIAIWLRDISTNEGRYICVEREDIVEIPLSDILESAKYASILVVKRAEDDLTPPKEVPPSQGEDTMAPETQSSLNRMVGTIESDYKYKHFAFETAEPVGILVQPEETAPLGLLRDWATPSGIPYFHFYGIACQNVVDGSGDTRNHFILRGSDGGISFRSQP